MTVAVRRILNPTRRVGDHALAFDASSTAMPAVPSPTVTSAADLDRVHRLIERHRHRPGPLLPLLHDVQQALGHVPDDVVPLIAQAVNRSRAEVHGVISYYHHFRRQPAGRHVVQVCRAEACQANGSEPLAQAAEALLGCAMHATRADGAVTLEPVYCLGLCATGPAVQIDDRLLARMTPERLAQRVHALGIAVTEGEGA